jgi:rhamnosyltransferase
MPSPDVRVLLATHNCEAWISEQLVSIAKQVGVSVSVVASDDCSSDRTKELLSSSPSGMAVMQLPALPHRLGNANRNFLRLIRDADVAGAAYVALADHDDVWLPSKLLRAVECMRDSGSDAYSGNVTAFWPDGRERMIVKSKRQRRFDFCFESPGPGCTFVITCSAFSRLQAWVRAKHDALTTVKAHDWLIYAFARQQGWRWQIDSESHMRYRQHDSNEIGANAGWNAALIRWRQVRDGIYRNDVLAVADAVEHQSQVIGALRRFSLLDRLWLASKARECRRDGKEAVALAALFMVMSRHDL